MPAQPADPHACCHRRPQPAPPAAFWGDAALWRRAARNTLACLAGCSIGDVAVLVLAQAWWPGLPMPALMLAAVVAGLVTSLAFESALLRLREGFPWRRAVAAAASMSLLSMLAMELAMNAVDFALTGGNRMHAGPGWYAAALVAGAVAGFLVPLPWNYWMLKRHGRACH